MRTRLKAMMPVLAVLLAHAGYASAEEAFVSGSEVPVASPGGGVPYGTTADAVVTIWAHDTNLFQGSEGPMNGATAGRVCASAPCGWLGGVRLPAGALIQGVEVSACDADATQQVQFALLRSTKVPAGPTALVPFTGTGVAATPGCATFSATLATPHTVDNDANVYMIDVLENPGTNIQWSQFRIRYRLQVSAAPATATFPSDVPTSHPFFRFVEALAAAGITGGCAPGTFCPDDPVTRGQMAVFLASALGLHFPN